MKKLIIATLITISMSVFATESSSLSKVKRIIAYSEYGDGDVAIVLESNGATCVNGYFLKKSDPGFDANFSMVLAAYHSKSAIKVLGHTDQKWAGSSGYYCHAYSIIYGD